MAGTKERVRQLRRELSEISAPASRGTDTILEAVAGAAGTVRGTAEVVQGRAGQAVHGYRGLAVVGGLAAATAWLVRHRHARRRSAATALRLQEQPAAQRRALTHAMPAAPAAFSPARRWLHPQPSAPADVSMASPPITATSPADLTAVTRNLTIGFVLPVWLAAGIADWICHRRARMETTSGSKESLIHLLMLAEASVPVVAGLLLEITSPVILLMFGAVVLHGATALWDVSFAVKRRTVTPLEQHVHSYLETVPLMATCFVTALHWPEFRALLGIGNRRPDWSVRRKAEPLPAWAVGALLAGTLAFEVAPYVEELWRDRRYVRQLGAEPTMESIATVS